MERCGLAPRTSISIVSNDLKVRRAVGCKSGEADNLTPFEHVRINQTRSAFGANDNLRGYSGLEHPA